MQKDGNEVVVNADEVIKLPNGSLTTIYHFMKNNNNLDMENILQNKEIEEITV